MSTKSKPIKPTNTTYKGRKEKMKQEMTTRTIDGVTVNTFDDIPEQEIRAYIDRAREKYPNNNVNRMTFVQETEAEGGLLKIWTDTDYRPFERIRRITGYLSRLDGFNNAKQAEEHDRVKHAGVLDIVEGQTPPLTAEEIAELERAHNDYHSDDDTMIWTADDQYIPVTGTS